MRTSFSILLLGALAVITSCRQDMHDQPKLKPQRPSSFFADGRANRPLVAGTIARGRLLDDELLDTGKQGAEFSKVFPFEITSKQLERGMSRYNIFCAPCHDSSGSGGGMIVMRGMKQPVSFHIDRLKDAAPGYYFDVMTNGFGAMYDYSDRISTADRWAIAAYIRVLQKSQSAKLAETPAEIQAILKQQPK
ncbi:MAG: cytochrome c [Planctomycetota bacterium]